MTCSAAFNPGSLVFIDKGPGFVPVTIKAGFVFKAGQLFPDSRSMNVVATGTFHNPFQQPVPFIELELCQYIFMTTGTHLGFESGHGVSFLMYGVAFGTIHGCPGMGTGEILSGGVLVARQALF
jgi:hypothetical protein